MFKRIMMLLTVIAAGDVPALKNAPKCKYWSWSYVSNKKGEYNLKEAAERLDTVKPDGRKNNPRAGRTLLVRIEGDANTYVGIVEGDRFKFVKHIDDSEELKPENLREVADTPEGKKQSNATYDLYISYETEAPETEAPRRRIQPQSRNRYESSTPTSQHKIEYTIIGTEIKLGADQKYRAAERRIYSFYGPLTLATISGELKHILIKIDGKWTLFIANKKDKTLQYGKRVPLQRGFTFEVGTQAEAEQNGQEIYAPTQRDFEAIKKATEQLKPTIYVLNEEDIKKAEGCKIDSANGLENSYIETRFEEFKKSIEAGRMFKRNESDKETELSIQNIDDIEKIALLDKKKVNQHNKHEAESGDLTARGARIPQFISLYMKTKDSSDFVLVEFDFDEKNDKLSIKVGDDKSVRNQVEKSILSNIAQKQPEQSFFWNVDQLKGKTRIEQLDMLANFFGTESAQVDFSTAKSKPGLYITKSSSTNKWDFNKYFVQNSGMGNLVYVTSNGKSLICEPKNDEAISELSIDDVQTAKIDDAKKSFARLIKNIINGIKVQYGDRNSTDPKVVRDYCVGLLNNKTVFGFEIGKGENGVPLYDPVSIKSIENDTITFEKTNVTDADYAKHFNLNRLCIPKDKDLSKAFANNPDIQLDANNNPTDIHATFEDQVKILLTFFLKGTKHPNSAPYNQRIVLHTDKLDKWEIGSTEAFLENKNNQYICLRDKEYLETKFYQNTQTKKYFEDTSTIQRIHTSFSDSAASNESLNEILEAMFKKKIIFNCGDYKYTSFLIERMQTPESRRQIINGAIACVARQNGFQEKYPEKILTIKDVKKTTTTEFKFKITNVQGNQVTIESISYTEAQYKV